MYDTQLKLIATTKMKGEQKEINKEKRKQEDEERNLKNDIPNALTGFLLKHINPITRLGKFVWPACLHWIRFCV